jgi:hypothetical protein
MAFYLAQASGTLNSSFPWSVNTVLSSTGSEGAVATAFDTAFRLIFTNGTLAPYIPTTVAVTETSVSTASATFKQTTKTTHTSTTPGTGTSAALPFHTCAVITFRTASATKWGRGRWYLPCLGTNALAASGFDMLTAAQTALSGAMTAYFTSVGTSYSHVILHRKATAGGARAAFTTDTVIAGDVSNAFAVQRRRADKLGVSRSTFTV